MCPTTGQHTILTFLSLNFKIKPLSTYNFKLYQILASSISALLLRVKKMFHRIQQKTCKYTEMGPPEKEQMKQG